MECTERRTEIEQQKGIDNGHAERARQTTPTKSQRTCRVHGEDGEVGRYSTVQYLLSEIQHALHYFTRDSSRPRFLMGSKLIHGVAHKNGKIGEAYVSIYDTHTHTHTHTHTQTHEATTFNTCRGQGRKRNDDRAKKYSKHEKEKKKHRSHWRRQRRRKKQWNRKQARGEDLSMAEKWKTLQLPPCPCASQMGDS